MITREGEVSDSDYLCQEGDTSCNKDMHNILKQRRKDTVTNGQVSEKDDSSLYDDMKTSTGIGLRVLFSNVVFRIDAATGDEGEQVVVYYGYSF